MRQMGKLKLFDDEENVDFSKIEIDKEYAKRLEYNKKREDLQRYEELRKRGVIDESDGESDDESSEAEEDNNEIIGSKGDLKFINALLLVKKQDPSLKEKDVKLFESESDGSEDEEEESGNVGGKRVEKKKKKAMYLKDVMAKHLIEEGPEFKEEKEEELGEKNKRKQSYTEEQEEMRKAFLDAIKEAEGNEEEDGFLKEKRRENNDEEDVEDDDNEEFVKKLDEYFGGDGELDEKKMFLKEFFKNKMWMDKEKKDKVDIDEEEVEDLLREDEELDRQELYETKFRHEEEVDDRVMGHSRKVEGSVRKKENARKEQRKSKEERMKIAELERQEELKHLKNLKRKEMKERMKKVMAIAGFKEDEDLPLNLKDLDDEFDPNEYDKMMKTVFGDNYYGAEDLDPEFGCDREGGDDEIEKPDFDKEDELLGLPKGWDVIKSGDGFKAARERSLKHKLEISDDDGSEREEEEDGDDDGSEREEEEDGDDDDEGENEGGEEENEVYEESKRKRKRKMSLVKRAKEEMLEEFYKLDYEDTIGDLKTRFKYAKVQPNRYGLKTKEVLLLDDNELNQYVSVKKLAPYREKEWKVPDVKRYQQKLKTKELLQGQKSDDRKKGKKKRLKSNAEESTSQMGAKGAEKAQLEEPDTDMGNLSKRAKTRRRQAKPKLSQSRLIAYGKIPSKAKSKVKH
ncbi:hypothetical protein EZV62_024700 [Acer yangbiense]|uniref:Kri1-like C-terminal domain-containing protein n=1 Tax=Acer yangbiense TaxID=1000413 RepID=A0A5C7GWF7_9ROSI|nr:hypothetical protein EZV62_024700 [Acer yangbiense]